MIITLLGAPVRCKLLGPAANVFSEPAEILPATMAAGIKKSLRLMLYLTLRAQ